MPAARHAAPVPGRRRERYDKRPQDRETDVASHGIRYQPDAATHPQGREHRYRESPRPGDTCNATAPPRTVTDEGHLSHHRNRKTPEHG